MGIYKSWQANMDEGWTRWLLEQYAFPVDTLHNKDVAERDLSQYSAIIFPSQSGNGILNGHMPNTMPKEYTGGIGLSGTLALRNYVENGGRLVALDASSDFFIQQFIEIHLLAVEIRIALFVGDQIEMQIAIANMTIRDRSYIRNKFF